MEAVKAKDEWLNSKWNAQSKLADHEEPAVYASVILSEKKVNFRRHLRTSAHLGRFSVVSKVIRQLLWILLFEIS